MQLFDRQEQGKHPIQDKQIILFGMSADPLHLGHIEYMRFVMDTYPNHLLVMMPCKSNPIEKIINGLTVIPTDGLKRFDMMNEVVHHYFSEQPIIVSDYEVTKPSNSYTYATIDYLNSLGAITISLLVGTDNLQQLPSWTNPQYILDHADILVMKRAGHAQAFEDLVSDPSRALHIGTSLDEFCPLSDVMGDLLLIGDNLYYVNESFIAEDITVFDQAELRKIQARTQPTTLKLLLSATDITALLPSDLDRYPGFRAIAFGRGLINSLEGPQFELSSTAIRQIAADIFSSYSHSDLASETTYHKLNQALHHALEGKLAPCTIDTLCRLYASGELNYGVRYDTALLHSSANGMKQP